MLQEVLLCPSWCASTAQWQGQRPRQRARAFGMQPRQPLKRLFDPLAYRMRAFRTITVGFAEEVH